MCGVREKLYEEKLRQQQQELKQLHEERQRLMEIQGKIQDLQWACPDLQVPHSLPPSLMGHFVVPTNHAVHSRMHSFLLSVQSSMSSAASGVAATTMMKKLPAAASTPAVAPSTSAKSNTAVLKHTTEPAPVTITDNEVSFRLFLPQNGETCTVGVTALTTRHVCADGSKALVCVCVCR